MNICAPFIRRPIGTVLLALGLFLVGAVAYTALPVASLPNVDLPVIRVWASQPGADPATMAATVAAPLERHLGEIAGVDQITSVSSLGATNISVQFDLDRDIDGAARDVQAAINAAQIDLPADMPSQPQFRKSNPAAAPILILALTSDRLSPAALYDAADTVVAQRISQVEGVAEATVSGAEQPAIRVQVDPGRLAALGVGMDDVRKTIVAANTMNPLGTFDGAHKATAITDNGQLARPRDYRPLVIKTVTGSVVHLADVASVEAGSRDSRRAGWFNHPPGRPDLRPAADRRQRRRHGRPGEGAPARAQALDPGRHRHRDGGRPHRDHPGQRRRPPAHPGGQHRPRHAGGLPLPAPRRADPEPPASPCRWPWRGRWP